MAITFPVDDVVPATAPLPTKCLAERLQDTILLIGDERMATVQPEELGNNLYLSALMAYQEHKPLVLTPDGMWLTIAQGVAAHIRENAEAPRESFVRRQRQKALRVDLPSPPTDAAGWIAVVEGLAEAIAVGPPAPCYAHRMLAPHSPNPPGRIGYDQRVLLRDVPWAQYEALLLTRGESARPRMTYLDGDLELMSPSIDHEQIKTTLARLVEEWANLLDLDLQGFGSWTVKAEAAGRGAEADECYSLGGPDRPERPDLAIEVNWTRGGIDKLEVWRGLGVHEVWMWQDDRIDVFVLRGESYSAVEGSELLPQMDLTLLARLARLRQRDALRALRAQVVV